MKSWRSAKRCKSCCFRAELAAKKSRTHCQLGADYVVNYNKQKLKDVVGSLGEA